MSAKFRYTHPDHDTCARCHQAKMRVVTTRNVGGVDKEQLTCSNPNCAHSIVRDTPPEPWQTSHAEEFDDAGDD